MVLVTYEGTLLGSQEKWLARFPGAFVSGVDVGPSPLSQLVSITEKGEECGKGQQGGAGQVAALGRATDADQSRIQHSEFVSSLFSVLTHPSPKDSQVN